MRKLDLSSIATIVSLLAFCYVIYEHIHGGHDALIFMFIALYLTLI